MESKLKNKLDSRIASRVALVIVLVVTLLASLRWAIDVTNANARQITHNLNSVEQKMQTDPQKGHAPTSPVP